MKLKKISYQNTKWRRMASNEMKQTLKQQQKVCDCYLSATIYALLNSKKGQDIFQKRVFIEKEKNEDPSYKIILSPNGKKETYRVSKKDYFGKFFNIYNNYTEEKINGKRTGNGLPVCDNNFHLAIDIAVAKMIKKHPEQKEFILRLFPSIKYTHNYLCELNRPSRAFEWLTGISPLKIGESAFGSLKDNKEEVRELLNELSETPEDEYSFVLLTGAKKPNKVSLSWHCLPLTGFSKEKSLILYDRHTEVEQKFTFDEIINNFKGIIGIRWNKI